MKQISDELAGKFKRYVNAMQGTKPQDMLEQLVLDLVAEVQAGDPIPLPTELTWGLALVRFGSDGSKIWCLGEFSLREDDVFYGSGKNSGLYAVERDRVLDFVALEEDTVQTIHYWEEAE